MTFSLRPLKTADLSRVAEIERNAFPTFWPRTAFKREMQNRRIAYLVATRQLSPDEMEEQKSKPPPPAKKSLPKRLLKRFSGRLRAKTPPGEPPLDTPLGFVSIWFLPDEAHITAIAVDENWRGKGLGELLLIGAMEAAMLKNTRVVTLEVRVSNATAISLYEKYGFRRVGVRKGYYTDNREDAAIMTTELIHSPIYQQKFTDLREAYFQRRGSVEMTLGIKEA